MPTTTLQLFLSMMRNIRSREMNRAMVGYSLEQRFPPATREAIREFARATRDENPSYDSTPIPAPPFFIARLFIPLVKDIWAHSSLKLNLLKTVLVSQSVTWHAPIREGDEIVVQLRIEDIRSSAKGEILKIWGAALIAEEVAVQGIAEFLMKSTIGTGLPRKDREEKQDNEAFRLTLSTDEGQQVLYAKASGDNNFIHTSQVLARMAGLPRTIMQGTCVQAMICNALAKHLLDNDFGRVASMSGRFGKPVLPGEILTIIGYKSQDERVVPFSVFNPQGRAVFCEGLFIRKA
jgi:acyl dehydratase